jgi:hypothetical protein
MRCLGDLMSQENEPRDSLEEFYDWIESLPLDEADTALKGLLEYEKAIQQEQFRIDGYIRYED